MLAGIAPCLSRDLSRKQAHNQSVFVGAPRSAVLSQERSTRAFFAAKSKGAVQQPVHEPLKANRNFNQSPANAICQTIDDAARHKRFPDAGIGAPLFSVL